MGSTASEIKAGPQPLFPAEPGGKNGLALSPQQMSLFFRAVWGLGKGKGKCAEAGEKEKERARGTLEKEKGRSSRLSLPVVPRAPLIFLSAFSFPFPRFSSVSPLMEPLHSELIQTPCFT